MAQLGDFVSAKALVHHAGRAFGRKEAVARARCVIAEAEIALASRDLDWPARALELACATLDRHGDQANSAHARYLEIRRLLLLGRLDEAEGRLAGFDPRLLPLASRVIHELILAGVAMRRVQARAARDACARAEIAAHQAGIPALTAEVESTLASLNRPAARLLAQGKERALLLDEVEAVLASDALVVDACRHVVRRGNRTVSLATRPILFALARALGEAWPADVSRDDLIARTFRLKATDESLRARLRVEVGRLRAILGPLAGINATQRGFALVPGQNQEVVVLARPVDEKHAALLALLADGESWSSSSLALVLGASQRTVQRTLETLAIGDKVQSFGQGRARRWIGPPMPGFATTLLLPSVLPVE